MKAAVVAVGNSKGIRLPKPILEQCGITDEVDLEVKDGQLIIHPVKPARSGWAAAFASMAETTDDALLDAETSTAWDAAEWRW